MWYGAGESGRRATEGRKLSRRLVVMRKAGDGGALNVAMVSLISDLGSRIRSFW